MFSPSTDELVLRVLDDDIPRFAIVNTDAAAVELMQAPSEDVNWYFATFDWSPDGRWFSVSKQVTFGGECARFWVYSAADRQLDHIYSLRGDGCSGMFYYQWAR